MMNKYIEVSLISIDKNEQSPLLNKVVETINSYLIKNKGAASDFNLIKDIVERHCDALDEEINQKLPVPLYLGLMGTVLGIIIGLFSLDSNVTSESFVNSIGGLIGGVKFAMICSLFGLTLTTILSAWFYRDAKVKLENQKNDLYSFVQTELLPALSQNATSAILTMQTNLQRFNTSFESNIQNFGGIMDKILLSFDSQVRLAEEMKDIDVVALANVNVNVLKELKTSMKEFETFNQYMSQMNTFVLKTAKLNDTVSDQLKRTDDVKLIVSSLGDNISLNFRVMEMLRKFLERVDENNAIISASADLSDALGKSIDQLRSHVKSQIDNISEYTTTATSELKELVRIDKGHLDKLNELSKLSDMSKAIADLKETFETQNKELGSQIIELAKSIDMHTKAKNRERSPTNAPIPSWMIQGTLGLIVIAVIFYISTSIYSYTHQPSLNDALSERALEQANSDTTTLNAATIDAAAADSTMIDPTAAKTITIPLAE